MEQANIRKELLSNIFLKGVGEIHLPMNCENISEIRLRTGRPVMFCEPSRDWFLSISGHLTRDVENCYIASGEDIYKSLQIISKNSIYAYHEELVNGYITLKGGHRVGIVGKTIIDKHKIKNITDYSGLNFRISREVKGCSKELLKYIITNNNVHNSLIISPPGCGKTTILRDIARNLSNGIRELYFDGVKIGIVDERSEICAGFKGLPQHDVGIRTDVLDNCPKEVGIMMLLRTMSPQVIITDEIGSDIDMSCIKKCINAGVKIITSFHGYGMRVAESRMDITKIINKKIFERIFFLSYAKGPGTLEEVYDTLTKECIYKRGKGA